MRHGDELEIVRQGIRIPPKTVEPLGIVDGSRCWGRWVRGQRQDSTGEVSHLSISPIHPAFWASVFHLEMRLDEHRGALDRATGLLSELGVNLLFSDGAFSGYKQATYTAVCELQRARSRAVSILNTEEFPPSPLFPEADSVAFERVRERRFQEIGASLLLHLADLQAQIRIRESEMFEVWRRDRENQPIPFLHSRAVETGPQPWYLPESAVQAMAGFISEGRAVPVGDPRTEEESRRLSETFRTLLGVLSTREHTRDGAPLLTQEALEARAHGGDVAAFTRHYLRTLWHNHWVEPVSLRGLLTLAYQRVWSDDQPRIVFQYDARNNMLRFQSEDHESAFFEKCEVVPTRERPVIGIASIHKHDRFIRLRVLKLEQDARLITTRVNYRTPVSSENRVTSESVTKGLLHVVASELALNGVDLLRVTSHSFVHNTETEKGSIKLVGFLPKQADADPAGEARALGESLQRSLEHFKRTIPRPGCTIDPNVSLYPRGEQKLFLSIPQKAVRLRDIVAAVEAVARQYRFVVVQARTPTGEVTAEVVERVEECDAMLQVYVARQGGPGKGTPALDWLVAEYALARGRRMPILRLRQEGLPDTTRDVAQLFDRDRQVETFSLDVPLSESLRPYVAAFLKGLARDRVDPAEAARNGPQRVISRRRR